MVLTQDKHLKNKLNMNIEYGSYKSIENRILDVLVKMKNNVIGCMVREREGGI